MTQEHNGNSWNEVDRLAALDRYGILDTAPEQDFDDLAQLAASLLQVPIAAVNLIAEGRQWFKAEVGLGVREMPLDNSICAHAILQPGGMVVPDTKDDPRFAGNPLVTGEPGLRFYAGELLESPEGLPIGTLCVLDTKPRPQGLTSQQRFTLKTLARQVVGQLDLRRALAEQQRLAAHNRQIVDTATDYAIISTDLAGQVTRWNAGAANVLGWSEEEMLGQSIERIFTPEDRASHRMDVEMRCASEAGYSPDERWHLRQGGERFWASGSMKPLRTAEGEVVGFVKVLRDRTEQHQAGAALEATAERYRLAAKATNDAIWDWDLEANIVLWNEALETAYGHAPDQVGESGEWWLEQVHPDNRPTVRDSIYAVIDGENNHWTAEYRFRRVDGSYAEVIDRGFVIRNQDGRAVRMIGAMLDLSRLKRAEAALRRSEDRLGLATSAARIGTFDYLVQRGELIWDTRCRELFGVPREGPVSYEATFLPGLHPDDRAVTDEAVRRALSPAGAGTFSVEYRTIGLSDGVERWVAANGQAFFENGTAVRLIGTVLDISARKHAEARLRELNDKLETLVEARTAELMESEEALRQSQKMEAVGQLTGGIAHDFNNLLTGIVGSLELLSTRLTQGRVSDLGRYLVAARGAADRAAALTHRLLSFSRRQTLDPKPTALNKLIQGMEDLIRRTVGPAVTLEVVGLGGLWTTLCDPHQLENALLNLCINARDAMPDGGRLTIETANSSLDVQGARMRDLPPGQYVVMCITDTGTGMRPDVINRAFEPFYTTKPIGQGTGLGLSMVYGFARQSGGQVRIYSELGQGTTIKIYLPRHYGDAEESTSVGDLTASPQASANETVLVVDDEPTVRMLVGEVLHELGYTTIEAVDGPSGLRVLQSDARIDLLVSDVGLPGGMNGRQLADAARVTHPDLKVLFITGYAENAVIGNGMLEPGMQVMTKPFAMEALATRIKQMLAAD